MKRDMRIDVILPGREKEGGKRGKEKSPSARAGRVDGRQEGGRTHGSMNTTTSLMWLPGKLGET